MEVFIWITIVSQIVSHAHNILAYLAYAAGFATGVFVCMYIENRLAIGTQVILAIIHQTHPRAFLTTQDIRSTQEGIFPLPITPQNGFLCPRKFK